MNDYLKKRQDFINAGRPLPEKKNYSIPKKSAKRIAKEKEAKEAGTDSALDAFYNEMRKLCNGVCLFCQEKTLFRHDTLWRSAIAHLLEKSKFKSVATREENWVELCIACHRSFDDGAISWLMLKDSHEWLILKPKLEILLPLVAPEEQKQKLYSRLNSLVYGNSSK